MRLAVLSLWGCLTSGSLRSVDKEAKVNLPSGEGQGAKVTLPESWGGSSVNDDKRHPRDHTRHLAQFQRYENGAFMTYEHPPPPPPNYPAYSYSGYQHAAPGNSAGANSWAYGQRDAAYGKPGSAAIYAQYAAYRNLQQGAHSQSQNGGLHAFSSAHADYSHNTDTGVYGAHKQGAEEEEGNQEAPGGSEINGNTGSDTEAGALQGGLEKGNANGKDGQQDKWQGKQAKADKDQGKGGKEGDDAQGKGGKDGGKDQGKNGNDGGKDHGKKGKKSPSPSPSLSPSPPPQRVQMTATGPLSTARMDCVTSSAANPTARWTVKAETTTSPTQRRWRVISAASAYDITEKATQIIDITEKAYAVKNYYAEKNYAEKPRYVSVGRSRQFGSVGRSRQFRLEGPVNRFLRYYYGKEFFSRSSESKSAANGNPTHFFNRTEAVGLNTTSACLAGCMNGAPTCRTIAAEG
eukprot:g4126.t1